MMPPVRRSLAVLIAALLAAVFAVVGTSGPANAAPKNSLKIVSVTNTANTEFGTLLVQNQTFKVVVQAVDGKQQPITVSKATTIELKEFGIGTLTGTTRKVIPVGDSGVTFSDLRYSPYENDVPLEVSVISGVGLEPGTYSVDVALTAVAKAANPTEAVQVTDSQCLAPTAEVPTCGQLLLPNGAKGQVTMSVGSCKGLGACHSTDAGTTALVVTANATLKDANGDPLYDEDTPATLVIACDKDLCRATANGVPKLPVIYTFDNDGSLTEKADPCPSKGTLGDPTKACVDYVSSSRSNGDIYLHLLYAIDIRGSM
jgi:hypothetical protein